MIDIVHHQMVWNMIGSLIRAPNLGEINLYTIPGASHQECIMPIKFLVPDGSIHPVAHLG